MSDTGDRTPKWIDPAATHPGPVRHDLTAEQVERARRLQAQLVEFDGQSVERWLDNLSRDADPDAELAIWEAIADALTGYLAGRALSPEAEREVFKLLLLRSMTTEAEVLARLPLRHLTREEALEVMRGYHHAPEPLRITGKPSSMSRSDDG